MQVLLRLLGFARVHVCLQKKKTQLFFQRVRVTSQSCDSEIESDGRCAAACSEYKAPAFSKPLKGFLLLVK